MNTTRNLLLLLFYFLTLSIGFAQQLPDFSCGFDDWRNPSREKSIQTFEEQLRLYYSAKKESAAAQKGFFPPPYNIPVVVHIIHDGGTENIPDAQILAAIDHLNDGFAAEGLFAQLGATVNTQIQFCLAKRDPDGNTTTGITRTQSPLTNVTMETQDIQAKDLQRWDPFSYVNIWVVKEITSLSQGTGVAGYAFFPSSHGQPEDGMICEARYFGTSPAEDAVLIHEMGHYFGLYHTFEGGCPNNDCTVDGDHICDTPPDMATHTTCPFNSCSTDVAPGSPFVSDVDDFTGDFMDYSPFTCYHFFTADQAIRMQGTIEVARASLLVSKGCGDPCTQSIAALFSIPGGPFSAGQTINLTNLSTGATTFTWEVNGAFFSSLADPVFTFPATGVFEITLTATNSDPNCSDKTTQYLTATCPVMADFTASATSIDIGETITFTSTSTAATDYQWFINGVLLGTGVTFNYTFSNQGNYTVVLEAGNGFCQSHQTVFVEVNGPCVGSVGGANFLYNIGNKNFYPYCITATPDGGVLTYGEHSDNPGHTAIIQKTDQNGNFIWANRVEGASEIFKTIVSPADNSYVLLGENKTNNTIFLMKISATTGATVWKKDFANLVFDTYSFDLLLLPGGDLIVLMQRATVARFSSNGNLIWAKNLTSDFFTFFTSMARRPDGTILIVGNNPSQGFNQSSVVFMDENGTILDTRFYGAAGIVSIIFNDVVANADNSFTVGGSLRHTGGTFMDQHGLVFKCDPAGNILWSKELNFQAASSHSANKNYLIKTSDGGYIVWGASISTYSNRLFMKIDATGNFLWGRELQVPNITMNLSNIDDNQSPGCWVAQAGGNRLLIAKVDGNGSAGGCNEISHDIPFMNINLNNQSVPIMTAPFALAVADNVPLLTPVVFQKQTLCSTTAPCPEICDNQRDDDEDGYVDCFDTDCDCFDSDTTCTIAPPVNNFSAQLAWQSTVDDASVLTVPIVANLNPQHDSIPEILVVPSTINAYGIHAYKLLIFKGDGSNAASPNELPVPAGMEGFLTAIPTVADLDNNGIPEVILVTVDGIIRVYTDFDPAATPCMKAWAVSAQTASSGNTRAYVADFDGDGIGEIFSGNDVYRLDLTNPATPLLIKVLDGIGVEGHLFCNDFSHPTESSTAADLLSRSDCNGDPDCDGLEIAAGYQIYSIDMDVTDGDGMEIKVQRDLNVIDANYDYTDGYTAVADLNLDGTPEIIVSGRRVNSTGFYVWNKNGIVRNFAHPLLEEVCGMVSVANVYDDRKAGFAQDFPDLIACNEMGISCWNLQKAQATPGQPYWWTLTTSEGSGATGAPVFDFNGDGILEIVYRDEQHLRIMYGGSAPFPPGVDAQRNWYKTIAGSGTSDEYPVVADLDNDGEAEIAVTSTLMNTFNMPPEDFRGRLRIFESASGKWMPARPIWNQYNYFGVNINDDLSVPKTQQKHWLEMGGIGSGKRPFNTHLAQVPSLNPFAINRIKAPDAKVSIDSTHCRTDSFEVYVNICNLGSALLPSGIPIAFYDGDPTSTAATLLFPPILINEAFDKGTCKTLQLAIPASFNTSIFAVINDDGSLPRPFNLTANFPSTDQEECHYENNMVSVTIPNQTPTLDLGPDITLCKNSVVELSASLNFQRYRWQDGSTNATFTAYTPGKYWVDAFDACGFQQTDTIQIVLNTLATLDLPDVMTVCEGAPVQLAATGFSKYTWAPADSLSCANCAAVDLVPQSAITIYLTAGNGDCFVSDSVRITVLPKPEVQLLAQDGDCDTPASITAIASGATPFVYLWSNTSTDAILNTLLSGTYTVSITDSNGCQTSDSAAVSIISSMGISANITAPVCANSLTGSIDLTVSGGTLPLQYLWSNSATTEDLINATAGTYSVLTTDANGCTATTLVTLPDPPVIVLTSLTTDPTCTGESSGTIDLTAVGGTGSLSFLWSNASSNEDLINLPSGTYTLVATDVNGCTATITAAITDPAAIVLTSLTTNPKCAGEPSGAIDLTAVGGTGILTFLWSNASPNEDLTNLSSGTYNVVTTDANGCTAMITETLTDPPAIVLTNLTTNPKCAGEASGAIDLTASGGTGGLTFLWSNASSNEDIINLSSGTYNVVTTDANGCTAMIAETLTDPPAIVVTLQKTDINCPGDIGSINLTASGGTPPFIFSWSSGDTTEDLIVALSGTYTAIVTDMNGCTLVDAASISILGSAPILTFTTDTLTCQQTSGIISASANLPNTSFLWSGAGGFSSTLSSPVIVINGTFSVTVTEPLGGCSAVGTVTVPIDTTAPTITLAAHLLEIPCGEDSISISAAGSSTGPDISIQWTTTGGGAIVSGANTLLPWVGSTGFYDIVMVNGANGCTATDAVEVVQGESLTSIAIADSVRCFGETNGTIQVLVTSGGIPPLMYSIDNQNFTTTSIFENLAAGSYQIFIRDANGCDFSTSVEVAQPASFSVELTGDSLIVQGATAYLQATVQPTNIGPLEIDWSADDIAFPNSQLEYSSILLQSTNFQINIIDENGCVASDSWLVRVDDAHQIYTPNIISPGSTESANQTFVIFAGADVQEIASLHIFDRWGNQVFSNRHFQPNDESQGWNGVFRGKLVQSGVFVWTATVLFKDGATEVLKGGLTVLR